MIDGWALRSIDISSGTFRFFVAEARDAAAFELRVADNVLEAYHAAYASADGPQTEVFAVTFNSRDPRARGRGV